MHVEAYKQKTSNLFAENKLLKLAIIALVIVSLVNWTAVRTALNSTRTVIVPIGAQGILEVTNNGASDDYLRAMSRYITNLLGTYTASTARDQFEELLPLFAPEKYSDAKQQFDELADRIERYPNITSIMHWSGREPLQKIEDRLVISTQKSRMVNGDTARTDQAIYEIQYAIRNGRFIILNIRETVDEKR